MIIIIIIILIMIIIIMMMMMMIMKYLLSANLLYIPEARCTKRKRK